MRRSILSLPVLVFLMEALSFAQTPSDLTLFQRYYGTMDYIVKGTGGIRSTGKLDPRTNQFRTEAKIDLQSIPANVDIVAAFLYWQSLEKTSLPSSSHGWISYTNVAVPPSDPNYASYNGVEILGKPRGNPHAAPCWSNGGSTGSSQGAPTLRVYRADVLRYLKAPGSNEIAKEIWVRLQDSGSTGNGAPLVEGASLILILRHPVYSFKSIVIFDGAQTFDKQHDPFSLDLYGYYQSSPAVAGEVTQKLTHLVGNGQVNFGEVLKFNGQTLATDPFANGWDDTTYDVSNMMTPVSTGQYGEFVNTTVTHTGNSFDCLAWGAVVFSTKVPDDDQDGLLNAWEQPGGFKDITTNQNVNRYDWGARSNQKDLFVEIDHMQETGNDLEGTPHQHRPKAQALWMVGKAFQNAGIQVHFDVGDPQNLDDANYKQTLLNAGMLITTNTDGGEALNERWAAFYCGTEAGCLFPKQPGLISWKKGINHVKNFYFNDEREFIFHYAFFGHALAEKGNLLAGGGYEARSISGRADLPGNTLVVTVGKWKTGVAGDPSGSANLQAATLLHELAHNLWGYHGGIEHEGPFVGTNPPEPIDPRANCNPNKQSSLNYLYQSAGLLDALGAFQVNLSGQVLKGNHLFVDPQDEAGLKEQAGLEIEGSALTSSPYRLRWYAPYENAVGRFKNKGKVTPPALTAAKSHCSGLTPVGGSENKMIRVDGLGYAGNPVSIVSVDWNYDKAFNTLASFLDINFDGLVDETDNFRGFNDWQSINDLHGLQQVGSGRNVFLLSLGVALGDLLGKGEDDLGEDDLGEDDLGETMLATTSGEDDLGEDDLGEDDLGEDDLGEIAEIDEQKAIEIGGNGPLELTAVPATGPLRIVLDWKVPAFGGAVQTYIIYRATGTDPFEEVGQTSTLHFEDTSTRTGGNYTYMVIGKFADSGALSSPSNFVSVTQ
jgi:hypothetical protein